MPASPLPPPAYRSRGLSPATEARRLECWGTPLLGEDLTDDWRHKYPSSPTPQREIAEMCIRPPVLPRVPQGNDSPVSTVGNLLGIILYWLPPFPWLTSPALSGFLGLTSLKTTCTQIFLLGSVSGGTQMGGSTLQFVAVVGWQWYYPLRQKKTKTG